MSRFHDHRARLAAALVPTMSVFTSVRFGRLRGCAKALRNLSALTLIGRCRCCRGRSGCPQGHHRMNVCCCYMRCRLLTNTAKAVKVPRGAAQGDLCSPCSSKRDRPKWRYCNISYQCVSDVHWHIHLLGIAVLQALLRNQSSMLAHCSFISPPAFHDTGDAF